jgi:hypothetical protein
MTTKASCVPPPTERSPTGFLRHVTVSGEGIVLHESGRVEFPPEEGLPPLFIAEPHQLLEGDVAAFCAALA